MGTPLVSILVPCYNAAPWIAVALESARQQTWPNVEIIVVDDGSGDGSCGIADQFASNRCQVLRMTHGGASAARNHALSSAQGDYIQYLDADDFLAPDKIETQMQDMRERGDRVLSFGSVVHFFDGDPAEMGVKEIPEVSNTGAKPSEFLGELWGGGGSVDMVQTGQWLTPRRLIEDAGMWNEQLSVDDDGEFFARVILAADRVFAVPDSVCYYRKFRRGGNLSASGCRESAMRAAQMKSVHLLSHSTNSKTNAAVCRLISREIVAAYPQFPEIVRDGISFLNERGLRLTDLHEGSPWFQRLVPWVGWRAARWLQWKFQKTKSGWPSEQVADSPRSVRSPGAVNLYPDRRPEAANCNRPRAIARPRA